jgi:benzoate 4-monooxygenase
VLNALGHIPLAIRPYMKYFQPDPFWYHGLRSTANLESIGRAAFGRRKSETTSRKDLMSFLLNAKDPESGDPLSSQEITAEVISFIVGGSDTTSTTMTHFVDFVSPDQSIQDRVRKELLDAFPNPLGDDWVAPEGIAGKPPYLNATLREVMRLRPTSSTGLERLIPEGGKIIVGTFVPGGSLVSVPTVTIHLNPDMYHVSPSSIHQSFGLSKFI